MKIKKLYFLLLIVFIGACDNWKENLENPVAETNIPIVYYSDYVQEIVFPTNATCLLSNGSTKLVGTRDGELLQLTNLSPTPNVKGLIQPKDTINCILLFTNYGTSPITNYLFIGSNKGIYQSDESGNNFKPLLIKSPKTGEYIRISAFEQVNLNNPNRYIINGYGWDGQNNKFTSSDDGKTWECSYSFQGKINAAISFYIVKKLPIGQQMVQIKCYGYENNNRDYIIQSAGIPNFILPPNSHINEFVVNNTSGTCFVATSNGLYKSVGDNIVLNLWEPSGLEGRNIQNIITTHNGTIFAGTDIGAFRSSDDGLTWYSMNFDFENYPAYFLKENQYSNIIYLISGGVTYYGNDLQLTDVFTHCPIVIYPPNNASNIPVDILLQWQTVSNINISKYLLKISKYSDFPDSDTKNIRVGEYLFYIINNLDHNTKYYWKIKTYNIFGSTDWSFTYSFTTN